MSHLARSIAAALVAAGAALVAGCIPTPPSVPREAHTDVPATFGGEDTTTDGGSSATVDWHDFFDDPHIVELVDLALAQNQELNIAIQEMIVANSAVMARRGDIFPSLSAGVGGGLERPGERTRAGAADETAGLDRDLPSYSLGLYASWEIDVWGRLRDSADAAMYRYLASAEGRNFMVTRLVAEIATRYYELLALDRQRTILSDTIVLAEQGLEMMRLEQTAGRVTMLAVARFEAQLREFEARRFDVTQEIAATENDVNFLVGRFPQHVDRTDADFLALTPLLVRAGLPTELLENRPDVRQAELALRASELDVSAARAAFYPSLRLDIGGGLASFDITQLVTSPGSIFYSLLAGITGPLLNRSGITADYFAANADQMAAVLGYERTILSAFREVSTALNLVHNLGLAYDARAAQADRLRESVDMSTLLFSAARADYLEVLTARRDYLESLTDLVETKERQLAAAVTLYQALGGGWHLDAPPEALETPEVMGAMP